MGVRRQRKELKRRALLSAPELFREEIRDAAGALLAAEMKLGALVVHEEPSELRDWLEERHAAVSKLRQEVEAVNSKLIRMDIASALGR